jgi:ribosomal-protein-alanine N-acetyltransferase
MEVSLVGVAALDVLAALHAASLEEPWSRRELALFLSQPGAIALVATAGDDPLGLALCRVAAEESELIALGVVPSGRRRGAGRALVERSIERVAAMGGARITLKVAEDNDAALRLYRAQGFVEVGRQHDYFRRRNDARASALLLSLELAPEEVSGDET